MVKNKKLKNIVPEMEAINIAVKNNIKKLNLENINEPNGKAFESICHGWICNKELNKFTEDDIDGSGEFGMDSINVEKNNKGGFSIKILSCTYSGGFSYQKTDEIQKGLKIVFEHDDYKKLINDKLKAKIDIIRKNKLKIQDVKVYYCINTINEPNKDCLKSKEQLLEGLREIFSARYDKKLEFDFSFLGAKEIFEKKMRNENPLSKKYISVKYKEQINQFNKNKEEELPKGKIEGCLITVDAIELKNMLVQCDDWIFHYNIRKFKGKNPVNKKIIETIKSKNKKMFWFLNNGVTMVCESAIKDRKGIIKLKYPQIVNGQQTIQTIKLFSKKELIGVDILVRLYITDNDEFFSDIAVATNSQTKIDYSDISSNKSEQHAIKYVFEYLGYYYKNKKGVEKKIFKRGIDSKMLGRISFATVNQKPTIGRKTVRDSVIFSEDNYKKLYDTDPYYLLLSFLIYNYCKTKDLGIKELDMATSEREIKHFGYFHLSSLMWSYLKEKDILLDRSKIIEMIENKNFDEFYNKAFSKIESVIAVEKNKNKDIILKDYFSDEKLDNLIFTK